MKSAFIVFCIILIAFSFRPTYGTYQFFKLSLQWPPSFQLQYRRLTTQKNFTIHGLWPQNASRPWPEHCSKSSFKSSEINNLTGQLVINWPNLHGQSLNNQFWSAQWNKHGTCSLGISPSATVTYKYGDIVNAIMAEIGPVQPELSCVIPQRDVLLLEVRVCLDAMGVGYISCPNNGGTSVTLCIKNRNSIKIPK